MKNGRHTCCEGDSASGVSSWYDAMIFTLWLPVNASEMVGLLSCVVFVLLA